MVISNVIGGLGNQMFQYAAGRAISLCRQTPLKLDLVGFSNYGLHQGFELQRVFSCSAEIASDDDVRDVLGWQSPRAIRRLLQRRHFTGLRKEGFIVEPHFNYWPEVVHAPADCYLFGYWQSEKYFNEIAATIRADFTFRNKLEARNAELADAIGSTTAISLHVRRGDYANNPKTRATHGLCSLDYYHAAIKYIAERVELPCFYIFSDDIPWVQESLKTSFPCEYVGHNRGQQSHIDMHLMSLCKHHVIANSSFSWWGAWLNPVPHKIVIAPKQWFANETATDDLIPAGWIRI